MLNIPIEKSKDDLWTIAKDNQIFNRLDTIDKKRKGKDLFYMIVQIYHPYSLFFLQAEALHKKSHSTLFLVFREYHESIGQELEKDPEFLKNLSFQEAVKHFRENIKQHYISDKDTFKELKAAALKELIESSSELKTDPEAYSKKINCYNLLDETFQKIR